MADTTSKSVLKLIATTSSKIRDLVIEDGNLVFLYDIGRIALDYKGKRTFYNQIVELDREVDRLALDSPLSGYYFVISTGCLWHYEEDKDEWTPITGAPSEVVFVGDETLFPELGSANKIYVNTTEGAENISVWSEELGAYVVVADKTQEISEDDILSLFDDE
jgi:hypothetical protein